MIGAKDVNKDFMNDFESKNYAYRGAGPVGVEIMHEVARIIINGKQNGKGQDLRNDVGKEDRKLPMQLPPHHHPGHPCLQQRMGEPEYVVHELCPRTHQVL